MINTLAKTPLKLKQCNYGKVDEECAIALALHCMIPGAAKTNFPNPDVIHSILSDIMPNPAPYTTGLKPFTAPDTSGGTVPLAAKISADVRDWLDSLPEGRSYHVR